MTLWGYRRQWDKPFEVTVVGDRRTKGIRVHRSTTLHRREITTQLGIRVTSPARTVIDMSPRHKDKALKRLVNNALNSLWLTEDQLAGRSQRHPTLPGTERIAKLIGLPGDPDAVAGGRTISRGSARTTACRRRSWGSRSTGTSSTLCSEAKRIIVELDSWRCHRGKIAFEADRERDAVTLARGFVTVRVTEERLDERPGEEASRLHVILRGETYRSGSQRRVDDLVRPPPHLGGLRLAERGVVSAPPPSR